jgi:hypothetical protein
LRYPFVTTSKKTQLKFNHSISFMLGLAILVSVQHFTAAQVDYSSPRTAVEKNFPETNFLATDRASHNGIRLAQDYFQTVRKTTESPFAPPANQAMPSVKTIGTNLKAFGVPFKINANNDSFIEVQLYLSRDMGKTWKFYSRQTTDQKDFPFQADQDGEYWFSLKTLDRDRRLLPEGDPQTELKIVVDTVKPTLDFRIETDAAGRVVCRWNAQDKNLSPDSFQILYQPIGATGPTKQWQKVPVNLNGKARVGVYADQIAWWPETTDRQLNVAVEIRDVAGNVAQAQRQVVVPQSAWRHRSKSVAQITDSNRSNLPNGSIPASQFTMPFDTIKNTPAEMNRPNPEPSNTPQKTADNAVQRPRKDHPPNVVCENGVCRIIPTQLIGSEVEHAEPPAPDQFSQPVPQPSTQLAQDSASSRPGSVAWPSDLQERTSRTRSSIGTTIGSTKRPDPSLAPLTNPMQTATKPVTDVPSNPATMKNIGDQVIGESSTMGRSSQYRGLNSRNGSALPPPTLLPGQPGNQRDSLLASSTHYPDTGHAAFEPTSSETNPPFRGAGRTEKQSKPGAGQWVQPRPSTGGGFSNAGFPNRRATDPQNQPTGQTRNSIVDGQARSINSQSAAPRQIVGTKRFRLEYAIDAIDPSGVARVDLWMTLDGRNWNAWGSDPDNQSPFPVEVQNDGRYGFRIVVHSKDGLTGQGPSTGDDADMWVLVDTQSPLTQITSVPYGREDEAGRLVINYSVSDDQLTLRPVTLAYAVSPQGPWNLIGEGLRNESRYVWKPKSDVPDQIYLRIDALDKAGNVGVHVLNHVIDVSGLVPRGTIRGVSPVGRN